MRIVPAVAACLAIAFICQPSLAAPARSAVKEVPIGGSNARTATTRPSPAAGATTSSDVKSRAGDARPGAVTGTSGMAAVSSTVVAAGFNARAVAARGPDYDRMPVVLGLEGPALEKYRKALAERNEGYEKWENSARGKEYTTAQREYTAARNGRNAERLADVQKKYRPLRDEQESVRRELRRELNRVFTPAQLRLWAGHMLYSEVISKFAPARLSDQQKAEAHAVCTAIAALNLSDGDMLRDPYLEPSNALKEQAIQAIRLAVVGADPAK